MLAPANLPPRTIMFRLFLSVLCISMIGLVVAEDKKPTRIAENEPTKLKDDADFAVQGEYEGEVELMDQKRKIAMQVIARGEGKFDIKPFSGGLPMTGDEMVRGKGSGARDGKVVKVTDEKGKEVGSIEDGTFKITEKGLNLTIKKVSRKSPTLGTKPPEGATVLYGSEKDVENWENGKVVELSDGKFLGATNCRSKKAFQNFTAHVEFRLAWMPNSTGQGRSNSGVYLQDRYECQVLDSFGLSGENNECGGFYQQAKPKVNMCFPPMVWQTYDIDFTAATFEGAKKLTNAKVTVKHNGVVIHENLEFTKATPGGKFSTEVPEAGGLFFQNHGDPVVFNNVWVVEKK
jgi:Domain of Unknown Function (DUF1080)